LYSLVEAAKPHLRHIAVLLCLEALEEVLAKVGVLARRV
jgi:hypothetical protein